MEKYITPEMEIVCFNKRDVIITSSRTETETEQLEIFPCEDIMHP